MMVATTAVLKAVLSAVWKDLSLADLLAVQTVRRMAV